MTQQPFGGGFEAPAQYQQPVAPQGPPAFAGQPQAQPQQGWGQQPGQAPAMQAAVNPVASSASFFGNMGGGGSGVPSYKWGHVGDVVQGVIKSSDVADINDYTTGETVIDGKTGQPARQLSIVLSTTLRNWDRVAKIPTDEQGSPLPPSEDDGTRAIYTGGKRTDGNSWMSGAIRDAMAAAGRDPAKGLEVGGMLGVMVEAEVPSGKGNPYRTYKAQYRSPGQQAPVQQAPVQQAPVQQAPVQQAPVQQAPVQQAPVAQDGWAGYVPPADQGQGLPQQPPANPFGGAPQQGTPSF